MLELEDSELDSEHEHDDDDDLSSTTELEELELLELELEELSLQNGLSVIAVVAACPSRCTSLVMVRMNCSSVTCLQSPSQSSDVDDVESTAVLQLLWLVVDSEQEHDADEDDVFPATVEDVDFPSTVDELLRVVEVWLLWDVVCPAVVVDSEQLQLRLVVVCVP